MPVLQPMPRKSLVKGAALARRLNAAATPAIAGTALYPELTAEVVERTDESGHTYYLVRSECAQGRYYGVRHTDNGWITSTDTERLAKKLIAKVEAYMQEQQEQEVAQAASTPTSPEPFLYEDEQGLYAEVASSTRNTTFRVGVCAKWLKTVSCTCAAGDFGKDCKHQVQVDARLRDIRPTFSEWIAGKGASQETINALLVRDRYSQPLKGSGVTGWKAASIERKLAA